jgi:K+-sensing histidine kinase KdpD
MRITRMLVLRLMAVLALLWSLLPKRAETYSVAAALFAIAAGAVGLAMIWLKPLSRDALELARILPKEGVNGADQNVPPPLHEELEQAYYALMRLADRARKMNEEGAVARAAIEEAEQLSASFLASMGHDLRGPLNNIVGFADLLVMDNLGDMRGVRESQRPSVEIIRCAAQDLLALLEQVIAWARLQSGPLQLDRKPIKAAELFQQVQAEAERRAASRSVVLRMPRLPDLTLHVDRKQMLAALLGVLDPSIRSGRSSEITLHIELPPATELGARRILFHLRDQGLRVRDIDHEGFFEAFRPSFAPSGQRIAGLGVGPALARALVRAHGGDVWLSSRADTGTTFTLSVPLEGAETVAGRE